jgi:hypothetical protein
MFNFKISTALAVLVVAAQLLLPTIANAKSAPTKYVCASSSWGRLTLPIQKNKSGKAFVSIYLTMETTGNKSVVAFYGNRYVTNGLEAELKTVLKRSRAYVNDCKAI